MHIISKRIGLLEVLSYTHLRSLRLLNQNSENYTIYDQMVTYCLVMYLSLCPTKLKQKCLVLLLLIISMLFIMQHIQLKGMILYFGHSFVQAVEFNRKRLKTPWYPPEAVPSIVPLWAGAYPSNTGQRLGKPPVDRTDI